MAKTAKPKLTAEVREYMRRLAAKGGKKGGKARAAKLTAEERRESARRAALARWGRQKARARRQDTES